MDGISAQHCRGFWCSVEDVALLAHEQFVVLPKLQWLAPFRGRAEVLGRDQLQERMATQFETVPMPVLVAAVREEDGILVETARGFIVPSDWRARAAFRQKLIAPQLDSVAK